MSFINLSNCFHQLLNIHNYNDKTFIIMKNFMIALKNAEIYYSEHKFQNYLEHLQINPRMNYLKD